MTTARGWRKWMIILICLLPTLTGITFVNIIPMIYNVRISLTDKNSTDRNGRPGRDFHDVGLQNYTDLAAKLFSGDALAAYAKIFLTLLPLIAASIIAGRISKGKLSPPDTRPLWAGGAALTVILWLVLGGSSALDVLSQSDFFIVVLRSVLYVILCMPLFLLVGLTLAIILNNPDVRFKPIWRTLLIVPWAVPTYITALIWQFFFRGQGTINQLLQGFGLQSAENPLYWLKDARLAFAAIVIVNVWMSYPFFMTIILGALQSIPADMYEAAEVDGASWWVQVTRITIPLLRPAVLPAVVLSSISTFQMFNTVWLITKGDPTGGAGRPGATDLVMTYAYKQTFQQGNYGPIGAFATLIFLLLMSATLLSLRVTNVTRGAYE